MPTYAINDPTGLLSRNVITELLERTDCERVVVTCLSPATDEVRRLWGEDKRVVPIVVNTECGAVSDIDRLAVDHVIHIGGRHAAAMYRLAHSAGAEEFHLVAEAKAREAITGEDDGPTIRVYTPTIVFGDSRTGEPLAESALLPMISRLARLPRLFPLLTPRLGYANVVPADYVAAALVDLIHAASPGTHHRIASPEPLAIEDIYNAFAVTAGAPRIRGSVPLSLAGAGRFTSAVCTRLTHKLPGTVATASAVANEVDIPSDALRQWTSTACDHAELSAVPNMPAPQRITEHADKTYRYWSENCDPDRAARAWRQSGLSGRRVLITGASSGIGRCTALLLAKEGARVLVVARSRDELDALCREIRESGGHAESYPCDLRDEAASDDLIEQVLSEHGGVDVLVNNAGRSIRRSVIDATDRLHDYQRTMALNYFAAVRLTLGFLPSMYAQRSGHIINVTTQGLENFSPRFSAYLASKAALDAFGVVAGRELLSHGITFSSVRLPLVETPMMAGSADYGAFWRIPSMSAERAAQLVYRAIMTRQERLSVALPAGRIAEISSWLAPSATRALFHLLGFEILPEANGHRGGFSAVAAAVARMWWRAL